MWDYERNGETISLDLPSPLRALVDFINSSSWSTLKARSGEPDHVDNVRNQGQKLISPLNDKTQ